MGNVHPTTPLKEWTKEAVRSFGTDYHHYGKIVVEKLIDGAFLVDILNVKDTEGAWDEFMETLNIHNAIHSRVLKLNLHKLIREEKSKNSWTAQAWAKLKTGFGLFGKQRQALPRKHWNNSNSLRTSYNQELHLSYSQACATFATQEAKDNNEVIATNPQFEDE